MKTSKRPLHAGPSPVATHTRPRRHSASDHVTLTFCERLGQTDPCLVQWIAPQRSLFEAYFRPPGKHRVPTKNRSIPVGTAVLALGILGSMRGDVDQEPERTGRPSAVHVTQLPSVEPAHGPDQPPPTEPSGAVEPPAPEPPAPEPPAPEPAASVPHTDPPPEPEPSAPPAPPLDPIGAWIAEASAILRGHGYSPDLINPDDIRLIIEHESNGDPSAFNGWDSNAAQGTPSKGLMQTIDPTFRSFALPGHGDVWNPVDNIIAGARYSIARYGSVSNVPGVVGVKSGSGYRGY